MNHKQMNKFLNWLTASNRHLHLLGGVLIGLFADGIYCAAYATIHTASALEFKDIQWGGRWGWTDWLMTGLGGALGYGLQSLLLTLI